METSKPSATLFHDTRRSKEDSKYPVKLSVYFDGQKKRYKTGVDLSKEDWIRLYQANLRDDQLKATRRKLNEHINKVEDIFDELEEFTFDSFEQSYLAVSKRYLASRFHFDNKNNSDLRLHIFFRMMTARWQSTPNTEYNQLHG